MSRRGVALLAIGLLMSAAGPRASEARVVRFVVEQRQPFAGGVERGTSGAYERLIGTAYMEVDPRDPLGRLHQRRRDERCTAVERDGVDRVAELRTRRTNGG